MRLKIHMDMRQANRESLGRSRRGAPHPRKPRRQLWTTPATAEAAIAPLSGLNTTEVLQQMPRILTDLWCMSPAAAQDVLPAYGHAHHPAAVLVATGVRGRATRRGGRRV